MKLNREQRSRISLMNYKCSIGERNVRIDRPYFISLRCPRCWRSEIVKRVDYDPTNAVEAFLLCPDCDNGGFESVHYFDGEGKEIIPK